VAETRPTTIIGPSTYTTISQTIMTSDLRNSEDKLGSMPPIFFK